MDFSVRKARALVTLAISTVAIAACSEFRTDVAEPPSEPKESPVTTVVYAQGKTSTGFKTLQMDIRSPATGCVEGCPTVIAIHGGGFSRGSRRDSLFINLVQKVVDKGYAVAMIDYRLAGDNPVLNESSMAFLDDTTTPYERTLVRGDSERSAVARAMIAAAEDANAAVSWIVQNGARYGLDGSRVALWGASAGAITAINVAYAVDDWGQPSAAQIVGVVDYYGRWTERGTMERGDPPIMVLHGTADEAVSFEDGVRIRDAAQEAGLAVQFFPVEGMGHGLDKLRADRRTIQGKTILDHTVAFFDSAFAGRVRSTCTTDHAALCASTSRHRDQPSAPSLGGNNRSFQQVDKNGDGVLSEDEFTAMAIQRLGAENPAMVERRVQRAFKRLDANGDGSIDRREMSEGRRDR